MYMYILKRTRLASRHSRQDIGLIETKVMLQLHPTSHIQALDIERVM